MEMTGTGIGERLKEARAKKGFTQEQVADMLNIGQSTYNEWENDVRYPPLKQVYNLSEKLEIPIEQLLRREGELFNFEKIADNHGVVGKVTTFNAVPTEVLEKLLDRYELHITRLEVLFEKVLVALQK